jgi:hypothetical protein
LPEKMHKIKRHPNTECPSKMHCVTLPTAALSASGKRVEVQKTSSQPVYKLPCLYDYYVMKNIQNIKIYSNFY